MAAKPDPILTPPFLTPPIKSHPHDESTTGCALAPRLPAPVACRRPPVRSLPSPLDRIGQPNRNLPKSGSGWASQSPHASLHWCATSLLPRWTARGSDARKKVVERLSLARAQVDSLLFCCFCWPDLLYTPQFVCFATVLLYQLIFLGFRAEELRIASSRFSWVSGRMG